MDDDGWPREVPRPPSEAELWQDDEPLETEPHVTNIFNARDMLRHHFVGRPDVFVGANMPVYFSDLQVRSRDFRAPDLFAVFGTEPRDRNFWVVWREGGKGPDWVCEVLSESTEETDRTTKMRIYERVLKVHEYFLHGLDGVLEGYRLGSDGAYVRIAPETDGRLHSHVLDLLLGLERATIQAHERHWLRFYHLDGTLVPTAAEAEAQRAEAETQRAEAEAQRADALARENERLRAELAALRGR